MNYILHQNRMWHQTVQFVIAPTLYSPYKCCPLCTSSLNLLHLPFSVDPPNLLLPLLDLLRSVLLKDIVPTTADCSLCAGAQSSYGFQNIPLNICNATITGQTTAYWIYTNREETTARGISIKRSSTTRRIDVQNRHIYYSSIFNLFICLIIDQNARFFKLTTNTCFIRGSTLPKIAASQSSDESELHWDRPEFLHLIVCQFLLQLATLWGLLPDLIASFTLGLWLYKKNEILRLKTILKAPLQFKLHQPYVHLWRAAQIWVRLNKFKSKFSLELKLHWIQTRLPLEPLAASLLHLLDSST